MNKSDTLPVGRIIGPHGIAGEVKLLAYGDVEGLGMKSVYVELGGKLERLDVKRIRRSKAHYLVAFDGFGTRNAAGALTGLEVLIRKEDLPELPDNEYYHADLVGTDVWTDDGRHLGAIDSVITTGGTDVLEVHGRHGEVLIPAAPGVIIDFDPDKKRMVVRLLEGLLPDGKT